MYFPVVSSFLVFFQNLEEKKTLRVKNPFPREKMLTENCRDANPGKELGIRVRKS